VCGYDNKQDGQQEEGKTLGRFLRGIINDEGKEDDFDGSQHQVLPHDYIFFFLW
jgi:hypothetical protein